MKLALIFLMAFVATSYQQQYQQRMFWMPHPYEAPQARGYYDNYPSPDVIGHSDNQPIYEEPQEEDGEQSEDDEAIQPSSVSYQNDDWSNGKEVYQQQQPRSWFSGVGNGFAQQRANFYYPFIQPEQDPYYYGPQYYSPDDQSYQSFEDQQIESRKRIRPMVKNNKPLLKNNPPNKFNFVKISPPSNFALPKITPPSNFALPKVSPAKKVVNVVKTNKLASAIPAENRFFGLLGNQILISSTNTFRFPFGKTSGTVVTSTLNLTSVVSCVASSEFVTANPTACRRRRRGMVRLLSFDDQEDFINPSNVENMEMTAAMETHQMYQERNDRLNELLASSKDDLIIDEDEKERNKRSFFYVSTTTFTSYTFFNTTVTKTVRLLTAGTTSGLSCLPGCFTVC